MREHGLRKSGRGELVVARIRSRHERDRRRGGAVVGAQSEDFGGSFLADPYTLILGLAVGNLRQGKGQVSVESGCFAGVQSHEDGVCRSGGSRRLGRVLRRLEVNEVGRVRLRDRADRVVDRRMEDRHAAGRVDRRRLSARRPENPEQDPVPLDHLIGRRRSGGGRSERIGAGRPGRPCDARIGVGGEDDRRPDRAESHSEGE